MLLLRPSKQPNLTLFTFHSEQENAFLLLVTKQAGSKYPPSVMPLIGSNSGSAPNHWNHTLQTIGVGSKLELSQVGGFLFYLKNFSPAQVGGFVRPTTRSLEQLDGYQPPYVITRPTTLTFNQRYCPHALIYIASRVALAYTSIWSPAQTTRGAQHG